MILTSDSQVMLLLCSPLGLPPKAEPGPLTLREWNSLARKIHSCPWKRPGELLGQSAEALQAELKLSPLEAERIIRLLDRGGALAVELERLTSLGIWVLTRANEAYPDRLRQRLKDSAPPVLYGAGESSLVGRAGLAIVGSRNVDAAGNAAAQQIGSLCAATGLHVYSGGARGVDRLAMSAALEAQGKAVGVLADSLERTIREASTRSHLQQGCLALLTPHHPKAGFSVGAAMGRNKLIYALADYAVVVASDAEQGGTWAGAVEALKHAWTTVFVCDGPNVPEGNRRLLTLGARSLPMPLNVHPSEWRKWLEANAQQTSDGVAMPPSPIARQSFLFPV